MLTAPWQVVPKVVCIPFSVPVSTYEQVPIDPPINTGCPVNWNVSSV